MTMPLAVEVLDLLKPGGKHTVDAIAEKLNAPAREVNEALATLLRSGCVTYDGHLAWDVVPVLQRDRTADR